MEYTFTLKYQLTDDDRDPDALVERLGEAGCDDALVGIGQPGRLALEFTREAADADEAVRSALAEGRLARLNVPDCTVMMHRQLFYHRDKWVTPQMNVFIELVRQGAQIK